VQGESTEPDRSLRDDVPASSAMSKDLGISISWVSAWVDVVSTLVNSGLFKAVVSVNVESE
jgi:hypothetical protein